MTDDLCDNCCRPKSRHIGRDLQCPETVYFRAQPDALEALRPAGAGEGFVLVPREPSEAAVLAAAKAAWAADLRDSAEQRGDTGFASFDFDWGWERAAAMPLSGPGFVRQWTTIARTILRLAAAPSATVAHADGVGGIPASDMRDILDTIDEADPDWQKKGYQSALAEVRDMANVGRALMGQLPSDYSYLNCPSEIVCDLINERDEALAASTPSPAGVKEMRPFDCDDDVWQEAVKYSMDDHTLHPEELVEFLRDRGFIRAALASSVGEGE